MGQRAEMKVATRLIWTFSGVVLLGVGIAAVGIHRLNSLAHSIDKVVSDRMVKVDQFTRIKNNFGASALGVRNILINIDPAYVAAEKQKLAEARADNSKLLEQLDKTVGLSDGRKLLAVIGEHRAAYNQGVDEAIELAEKGGTAEAGELLLGAVLNRQNLIFQAVDESIQRQRALAEQLVRESVASARGAATLMMALAALMAIVGTGVAWLVINRLNRSLGGEPALVKDAVQRVADGDLTTTVPLRAGDDTSVMATVARMQKSLAGIVTSVRSNSESVATASSQIAQGNQDLSQRTEQQASALQQTAASMEELSTTVKQNADNAMQANQLAQSASTVAVEGGEVVSHVVETMRGINDSSRKIADIIGVIDSIAFQTNILALNAAVEAARAGEQGRGFAVVASEVRNLAQRSAEAAREIKTLITASVERVEQGTALVDRAGATMNEVVTSIRRVTDIVAEISSASSEQSAGVAQIGQAVTQMDQATQQNAALVEESAAAAESLKSQAQQLVQAVAVFRTSVGARRAA